jgi:hypothetical protein
VVSYTILRRVIGYLGIGLPIALWLGDCLIFGECGTRESISAYYHSGMGDVFVGALCAIGVFLLSYRGPDPIDGIMGNIACAFAVGVALFPTAPPGSTDPIQIRISMAHHACAAGMFLTLAGFAYFLFTKTDSPRAETPRKIIRNSIYRVCAWIMVGCMALIAVKKYAFSGELELLIDAWDPVFWLESFAIWAFGVSWLVKGEQILQDRVRPLPPPVPQTQAPPAAAAG